MGCVGAVVMHGRLVAEATARGVAPLFLGCLLALVAASAITTRLGGVTRGSSAAWNLTTASVSCLVLTAVLAGNTPSMRGHVDLSTVMYLGLFVLAMFAPLATVQVIVGWLAARRDVRPDVVDGRFVRSEDPRWRQGIAAALASIEDRPARRLDAAERQWMGELALDLGRDPEVPAPIGALGARLRSALAGDAGRRPIAAMLAGSPVRPGRAARATWRSPCARSTEPDTAGPAPPTATFSRAPRPTARRSGSAPIVIDAIERVTIDARPGLMSRRM